MKATILLLLLLFSWKVFAFDSRKVSSDFLKDTLLKEISTWSDNDDRDEDIISVNQKCKLHMLSLLTHITQPNVLRLFDSWGKIPTGLLYGHLQSLGNYEECLNQHFHFGKRGGPFTTQYCLAKIPLTQFTDQEIFPKDLIEFAKQSPLIQSNPTTSGLELAVGIGICLPKSCNPEKISNLTTLDYIGITVIVGLGILLATSSLYDYFTRSHPKKQHPTLLAWSLQRNLKKLFDVTTPADPDSIQCLNGMRVLSMLWILCGQELIWSLQSSYSNLINGINLIQNSIAIIVLQTGQAAETFFYFSGFLVSWIGLRELERRGKKFFLRMYIHRFLRLTPSLAVVILFCVGLFKYFGAGPFWPVYEDMLMADCEQEWWKTLLYIQNYVNPDKTCLPHTWYLAVDTQLFILSPLLLLGFLHFKRKFIALMVILVGASIAGIYITFFHFNISKINYTLDTNLERRSRVYVATHTRCISWLIGLTFGYFLRSLKGREVKISSMMTLTVWMVAAGILSAVVWGPIREKNLIYNATIFEAASFEAFSKIGWSVSLSLILFLCYTGNGGSVGRMLSHPAWRPLARISFAVYLVHYVYQPMKYGNVKTDLHLSYYDLILASWATFGPTFLFSVLLVILVEYPIMELERIIFARKFTKTEEGLRVDSKVV